MKILIQDPLLSDGEVIKAIRQYKTMKKRMEAIRRKLHAYLRESADKTIKTADGSASLVAEYEQTTLRKDEVMEWYNRLEEWLESNDMLDQLDISVGDLRDLLTVRTIAESIRIT